MTLQEQISLKNIPPEIDRRKWLIRYLILIGVCLIFLIKLTLLFRIDILAASYSILTTFVMFAYLWFAYLKYRDPYYDSEHVILGPFIKPFVSIILPVKNEQDNIRRCVQCCLDSKYENKEIIVIDDASTDKTGEILDSIRHESPIIQLVHLEKNVGKKKAIEIAAHISKGEIFAFVDSDAFIAPDAIENAVKIFVHDKEVGAIAAHVRSADPDHGNLIRKLHDVRLDNSCRILKGMEGSFSSVTCCSGALSLFRRAAIEKCIHAWANDKFLGKEFKFATDRRLTGYILEAKRESSQDLWKIQYSMNVRVYCIEPETVKGLIRQRIRWNKSFIRSIFATGPIYWKRPLPAAVVYYLHLGLKLIRPYILIHTLILLPLTGNIGTAIFFTVGLIFTGSVYSIDFRLRNENQPWWIYRILMQLLSSYVFPWLLIYSALTIRKMSWR
jgi:hyaluronan synthase